MQSVARWAPEARRIALLVDRPDGFFDPAREDFEIRQPSQVSSRFFFQYSVLEASTALKADFLKQLLDETGARRIVYLDPDIFLFAPLTPVWDGLARHSIVLTPHLLDPIGDGTPSELDILQTGVYNLGFLGLAVGAEAGALLDWWSGKLASQCLVAPQRGLFVDQRWMDLAPALFPNTGILRDPGLNVAYWNIGTRPLSSRGNEVLASGVPLRFFHFSGFNPESPMRLSRHQPRISEPGATPLQKLLTEYDEILRSNGWDASHRWPYSYAAFENGQPLPDVARCRVPDAADPFGREAYGQFVSYWHANVGGGHTPVSRLAWRVWQLRPDVQEQIPDPRGEGWPAFRDWFEAHGAGEHGLVPSITDPLGVSQKGGPQVHLRRQFRAFRHGLRATLANLAKPFT